MGREIDFCERCRLFVVSFWFMFILWLVVLNGLYNGFFGEGSFGYCLRFLVEVRKEYVLLWSNFKNLVMEDYIFSSFV